MPWRGVLLTDAGIIRNRAKIAAIIDNARRVQALRETHGGFAAWLSVHHPRSKEAWLALFRQTFRFVGGEIVGEFLMSTGFLPGAHRAECPIYAQIKQLEPPWAVVDPAIFQAQPAKM